MKLLNQESPAATLDNNEISLSEVIGVLIGNWRLIASVSAIALLIGAAYAFMSTPVYRAEAMIQIETDAGPDQINEKLGDLASLFQNKATADAEIELIRSRMVVEEAVRALHLDVVAAPHRMPLIGEWFARRAPAGAPADPVMGLKQFAWGGESLDVTQFDVPAALRDRPFRLQVGNGGAFELSDQDGHAVLQGRVGTESKGTTRYGPVTLNVGQMVARAGTSFDLRQASTQQTTAALREALVINEKAKQSGIVGIALDGTDAALTAATINRIATIYVQRNVDRKSAQAEQMLRFLGEQLPQLRADLDAAEARYNDFRTRHGTIDLESEGKLLLQSVVDNKTKLVELQQQRVSLAQRYTAEHPQLQVIDAQIAQLRQQQGALQSNIEVLPEVQREALQLMRDVRVDTDLYTKLLDSTQQLRILKAGQLGNVRTVDYAEVGERPVKPKKALVLAFSLAIGLVLGSSIAFVRRVLNRGLETPAEIERAVGVPVYAIVSQSARQKSLQQRCDSGAPGPKLLAVAHPMDVAVEGIRSLRTALQFGLMKSASNVVMLTGPRPGVGKSFVSVNLAAVLSVAGKRVLLIDGDMRRGNLQKYYSIPARPGLSDVMSGAAVDKCIHRQVLPNLDVLTSGTSASTPAEILMGDAFGNLLAQLGKQYDLVIVDSPPVLAVTDPVLMSKHAGLMLLVIRHGQHSAAELQESARQLSSSGKLVDGILLNGVPDDATAYGAFSEYGSNKDS
jgi:tyrosine-protein kinase Etk/Wzc